VPPGELSAEAAAVSLPGWLADARHDARYRAPELERNEASEFSFGEGRVTPWVERQARAQRRVPQPSDGYSTPYRGTTPPSEPDTRMSSGEVRRQIAAQKRASHGSRVLGQALRRNG
jgi:hypothetical protein